MPRYQGATTEPSKSPFVTCSAWRSSKVGSWMSGKFVNCLTTSHIISSCPSFPADTIANQHNRWIITQLHVYVTQIQSHLQHTGTSYNNNTNTVLPTCVGTTKYEFSSLALSTIKNDFRSFSNCPNSIAWNASRSLISSHVTRTHVALLTICTSVSPTFIKMGKLHSCQPKTVFTLNVTHTPCSYLPHSTPLCCSWT